MTKPIDIAIEIAGSQNALAKKAKVSQACISKLSSGVTKQMDIETAKKIRKVTGMTMSQLLPELFADEARMGGVK